MSQSGKGIVDMAKKLFKVGHAQIKKEKVISRLLDKSGFKKASSVAAALGYGRRRRRVVRRI